MSVSASCSLLLEVCNVLCTDLILGTCVSGEMLFFSSDGEGVIFQYFAACTVHISTKYSVISWFSAAALILSRRPCTCNCVAPLTPFCCLILKHSKHWTYTPSGSGYYLRGAAISQYDAYTLTHTQIQK